MQAIPIKSLSIAWLACLLVMTRAGMGWAASDDKANPNPKFAAMKESLKANPGKKRVVPDPIPPNEPGGYTNVTIAFLQDFKYEDPSNEQLAKKQFKDQFPDKIKALNNAKVTIDGFMFPTEMDVLKVRKFMLIETRAACCFGIAPPTNGWIEVDVRPKFSSVNAAIDAPITVSGTLRVGENVTDGALTSVYQLKLERIEAAMSPGARFQP